MIQRIFQLCFLYFCFGVGQPFLIAGPVGKSGHIVQNAQKKSKPVSKLAGLKQQLAQLAPIANRRMLALASHLVDFSLLQRRIQQGKWDNMIFYMLYAIRKMLLLMLIFLTVIAAVNGLILIKMGESSLKAFVPFWGGWVYCSRLGLPKGIIFARLSYQVFPLLLVSMSYYAVPIAFLLMGWLTWARQWRYIKWRRLAFAFGYRAPKLWLPCYLPFYVTWHILFTNSRFRPSNWKSVGL